jgi:hypothetical protein
MAFRVSNMAIKRKGGRAIYSGEVDSKGTPDGYGERVLATKDETDGFVHMGSFKHGSFHGTGKSVSKDGEEATGQWEEGVLHGVAFSVYPGGDSFSGQFKRHKFDGLGMYKFKDGGKYIGQFSSGHKHGIGMLVRPDGVIAAVTHDRGMVVSLNGGKLFLTPKIYD